MPFADGPPPGRSASPPWAYLGISGLVVLAVGVAAFAACFHEPWRDETEALLAARHSTSLLQLLQETLRYNGHPPLLYLVLRVTDRWLAPPWSLAAASGLGYAALVAGTFRLLRSLSGRRGAALLAAALFALTYDFAYELGVITRGYGLGLGLFLLGASWLLDDLACPARRALWCAAIAHALAASCTLYAACWASASVSCFAVLGGLQTRRMRALLPLAVTLPFLLLDLYIISPNPDRFWLPLAASAGSPTSLLLSLPSRLGAGPHPWHALAALYQSAVVDPSPWWPGALDQPLAACGPLLVAIFAVALATGLVHMLRVRDPSRWGRRYLVATLLSGSFLLVVLSSGYRGFHRHHLHLIVFPSVVLMGTLLAEKPFRTSMGRVSTVSACAFLALWLATQLLMASHALVSDARFPFSLTRDPARSLPRNATLVSQLADYVTLSVSYWRPDVELRAREGLGRTYDQLRWDARRRERVSFPELLRDACGGRPAGPVFAVLGLRWAEPLQLQRCWVHPPPVPEKGRSRTGEFFRWTEVDCACVRLGLGRAPDDR
jgi:hypothetical protein